MSCHVCGQPSEGRDPYGGREWCACCWRRHAERCRAWSSSPADKPAVPASQRTQTTDTRLPKGTTTGYAGR